MRIACQTLRWNTIEYGVDLCISDTADRRDVTVCGIEEEVELDKSVLRSQVSYLPLAETEPY